MSFLAPRHRRQFTLKYVGLDRDLAREIAWKPMVVGDRLETEKEIADRFGLSRASCCRSRRSYGRHHSD